MTFALALALLVLAFFFTLRAVTAASTERLLWGSLLSSMGLGLAVQLRGGGYYGILMVAVFVVTDLMLYLFFRSLKLMPNREALNVRVDRIFRIFFLWIFLCAMAGFMLLAFAPSANEIWQTPQLTATNLLYERVWAGDWLLAVLPVLGLVVLVTGGFFLVRREE